MGFYDDVVLPRLIHWAMSMKVMKELRQQALAPVTGTVLEVGFGSGHSIPHYGTGVSKLLIVEPSQVALGIARKSMLKAPFPIETVGLDGERLNLADASVDWVVTHFTLCTIPHAEAALAEMARVLKPGGGYSFAEHGLSPDEGVARWQHRLNGIQRYVAGGCNLDRPIDTLVQSSSLRIENIDRRYIPGPKTHGYVFLGAARKAG
jgi:ubiquinone/menaquinone biosynthesis C-methylase UbiE